MCSTFKWKPILNHCSVSAIDIISAFLYPTKKACIDFTLNNSVFYFFCLAKCWNVTTMEICFYFAAIKDTWILNTRKNRYTCTSLSCNVQFKISKSDLFTFVWIHLHLWYGRLLICYEIVVALVVLCVCCCCCCCSVSILRPFTNALGTPNVVGSKWVRRMHIIVLFVSPFEI